MRIAMEKSGLLLAVKKLRLQRSNKHQVLKFLFLWFLEKRSIHFLDKCFMKLVDWSSCVQKVFMSGNTNGVRTLYSFSQPLDINFESFIILRVDALNKVSWELSRHCQLIDLFTITSVLKWICCRVFIFQWFEFCKESDFELKGNDAWEMQDLANIWNLSLVYTFAGGNSHTTRLQNVFSSYELFS
jgi:hypothetical protein